MPAAQNGFAPSSIAQWVSGVATSLAVIVALFKEAFWGQIRRPRLKVRIKLEAPDCVKTPIVVAVAGQAPWTGDAFFLRLWIENEGSQRAEKVQVFLANALRQHADQSFKPVPGFLPMNLRWSNGDPNRPEIYADGISPEMGKHCDLASISDPANPTAPLTGIPTGQVTLDLWLEVFPLTQSHRLSPGVYELEIKVAGSNCRPVKHRVRINLTGQWFSDESRMFSQGIGITLLT